MIASLVKISADVVFAQVEVIMKNSCLPSLEFVFCLTRLLTD